MRIAILADIHGNSFALDAVLADIARQGSVDAYWVLGDISANGCDPAGVAERIAGLPNAVVISGNGDRYTVTEDRPRPTLEEAAANPALLPNLVEVAGSFGWVRGVLQGCGLFEWMRDLPSEVRLTLPDGTRVLLVHASPGSDSDPGLNPALTDAQIATLIAGAEADLICVGHFHMPMQRRVNGVHLLNPGSAGASFAPDLRASYAILTADSSGYSTAFHRVPFDIEAAIHAAMHSGSPGWRFAVRFLRGEIRAGWMDRWDGVAHLPPLAQPQP